MCKVAWIGMVLRSGIAVFGFLLRKKGEKPARGSKESSSRLAQRRLSHQDLTELVEEDQPET